MKTEAINVQERTQGIWELWKDYTYNTNGEKTPCFSIYGQKKYGFGAILKTVAILNEPPASKEAEANAAYIVEACNSYDKLKESNAAMLEALKETQREMHNTLVLIDAVNNIHKGLIAPSNYDKLESAKNKALAAIQAAEQQ